MAVGDQHVDDIHELHEFATAYLHSNAEAKPLVRPRTLPSFRSSHIPQACCRLAHGIDERAAARFGQAVCRGDVQGCQALHALQTALCLELCVESDTEDYASIQEPHTQCDDLPGLIPL